MIQLREKDLSVSEIWDLGTHLKKVIAGRAAFVVNDRVDIAIALEADGVQLPEDGLPVEAVRRLIGRNRLIGRSVHSIEAAVRAGEAGSDFLIAGTIFESASHQLGRSQGTRFLRELGEAVTIPYLAIGGVTTENVGEVMDAGASGGAVITAISESKSPFDGARSLVERMAQSRAL